MTKGQQALCNLMSEISEEAWCAGWMAGLEYALWYAVVHGPMRYGVYKIDEVTIRKIKELALENNCWITFEDATGKTPMRLAEWEVLFRTVDPVSYLLPVDL